MDPWKPGQFAQFAHLVSLRTGAQFAFRTCNKVASHGSQRILRRYTFLGEFFQSQIRNEENSQLIDP